MFVGFDWFSWDRELQPQPTRPVPAKKVVEAVLFLGIGLLHVASNCQGPMMIDASQIVVFRFAKPDLLHEAEWHETVTMMLPLCDSPERGSP